MRIFSRRQHWIVAPGSNACMGACHRWVGTTHHHSIWMMRKPDLERRFRQDCAELQRAHGVTPAEVFREILDDVVTLNPEADWTDVDIWAREYVASRTFPVSRWEMSIDNREPNEWAIL